MAEKLFFGGSSANDSEEYSDGFEDDEDEEIESQADMGGSGYKKLVIAQGDNARQLKDVVNVYEKFLDGDAS